MNRYRFFTLLALLAGTIIAVPAVAQTTHMVTVGDNFFSPSELTIAPGDTVQWNNAVGGNPHDVTSNTGAWTAPSTATSFTFSVTFNDPGTFNYHCTVHAGMTGVITVQAAGGSPELQLLSVAVTGGSLEPGGTLNVRSRIRNNGDADAGGYQLTYYLSSDETITTGDTSLDTFSPASGPDAGATTTRNDTVSLPGNLLPGSYFVGAIITFADGNQGNNVNHDPIALIAVSINAGLNDAWYNVNTAGQGFFFNVFPNIKLFFLAWFTFDSVPPDQGVTAILGGPGQRWVTASGSWDGNTVTLNAELTTGGVFNSPEPMPEQTQNYGTITIVFHDCNHATLSYNFPSLGLSGQIELTRVTTDNVALCEALSSGG